jgi:hypothetical protein
MIPLLANSLRETLRIVRQSVIGTASLIDSTRVRIAGRAEEFCSAPLMSRVVIGLP